jgi:flagellar biosynthetic protein FliO
MRFGSTIVVAQATRPIENPIHRTTATSEATATSQPSAAGTLDTERVLGALVAVLALILVLRWALRKLTPALARSSRAVRVVGRTYIGPKQQVLVLQVGRRVLIVGDSGQQLNTLCEINDPDEAAALLGQLQGTTRGDVADIPAMSSSPTESDPALSSTRTELNGLTQRVRLLARHLGRA